MKLDLSPAGLRPPLLTDQERRAHRSRAWLLARPPRSSRTSAPWMYDERPQAAERGAGACIRIGTRGEVDGTSPNWRGRATISARGETRVVRRAATRVEVERPSREESAVVPELRIRSTNNNDVRSEGSCVLYWMTAFRRLSWNFSLDRSIEWAQELGKPLVILESLRRGYPWASERLHGDRRGRRAAAPYSTSIPETESWPAAKANHSLSHPPEPSSRFWPPGEPGRADYRSLPPPR